MSWLDTLDDIRTRDFSKASMAERDKVARDVINMCSYAASVVSISPVPFSDVVLMLPIQTGMVMTLGHIYGRKLDKASAKQLILELGATAGAGFLARQGVKALLPVFGAVLTVVPAFAANWAIGRVAAEHFKNPGATREEMKEIFRRAKDEGKSLFSKDSFNKFRKQHGEKIQAVEDEPAERTPPEAEEEEAEQEAAPPAPRKKVAAKKPAAKKPAAKKAAAKKPAAKKQGRAPSTGPEELQEDVDLEAPLTVRSVVEQMLPRSIEAKPHVARGIGAVVHLDIRGSNGGQWTVDFGAQRQWVRQGLKGTPRVTVRCQDDDFLLIASGKKDPRMAVMMGSLEFDPLDLELAEQVGQLLA